jgi:hypothetical protein
MTNQRLQVIGSIPTVLLLWFARGSRGSATAGPLKRRVLSVIALCWGAASLAVPFLVPSSRGGLGPMSLALMLWINFWKTMDICAGTAPPSVLTHWLHLLAHLTFLIEYKTSRRMLPRSASELQVFPRSPSEHKQLERASTAELAQDQPETPHPSELMAQVRYFRLLPFHSRFCMFILLRKLTECIASLATADTCAFHAPFQVRSLCQTTALFFCLTSASELTAPAWLASNESGAFVVSWVAKYSHVWYIYCFLKLACDTNSTALLILGYRPQVAFRNPLTASTSPTDFWSRRWNMLVRGLFHRTVFTPLRNRKVPSWMAALSAFVVSGAFHEYAFAPASHGAALGSLTIFFCIQAAFCSAELLVRKASASVPVLRTLDALTPDWARVLLTSAMLVPFSPLFMAPLNAHGTLDQMRTIMLRVRLTAV